MVKKRPTVKFFENWRTGHIFSSRKLSWLYQISSTHRKLWDRPHVLQQELSWLYQISSTHRKLWDRPHVLQQETQLAVSNFLNSQKTGGQATCSSAGNSAGCIKFPQLTENCGTGHMFFSRKLSWLYHFSSTHRKLEDRPHFLQQETQLAVSNFFNSQKTGGQATFSPAGNSAGCIKFLQLTENWRTGHMFFSRKLSWLYQISSTHRKLVDRPHVLQQETQLAVSNFLYSQKTGGQATFSPAGNSAGCITCPYVS